MKKSALIFNYMIDIFHAEIQWHAIKSLKVQQINHIKVPVLVSITTAVHKYQSKKYVFHVKLQ